MRRAARRVLLVGLLALAAGGANCSGRYLITNQENFYSYERPFTDASGAEVRRDADELCRRRGKTAVELSDICELGKNRCFTNFQCVGKQELPQVVR